ncbi:MAG: peptidoglycan-binding domain-containing protein [Candidatus Nanopelagicales bacterium]
MLVSSNGDKASVAGADEVGAPTVSATATAPAPAPTPTVTKTKTKTKIVTPAPPPVVPYSGNARAIACDSTLPNSEELYRGDTGESVAALQWALASLNYVGASGAPLRQDGQFGAETERAVLSFQGNHGLPNDGIVDQITWSTMNSSLRSFQGTNRCY